MTDAFDIAVEILDDAAAVAQRVAALLCMRLARTPRVTLGLATGGTMAPVYDALVERARRFRVSFAAMSSFNLDEYVGLRPDHAATFRVFMQDRLFDRIDVRPGATHLPGSAAADPEAEAGRYERAIAAAGGIDLQLLGIGRNGHIGFNEPGSDLASRTRVVDLTPQTRLANAPFFPPGEAVPARAITMGVGTILDAREIVLVATGAAKAEALAVALAGPIGPACPASALRLHGHARIVCDREAARALPPT